MADAAGGAVLGGELRVGELTRLPLASDASASSDAAASSGTRMSLTLTPARGWDVGAGPGEQLSAPVTDGVVGLVLDARGRPLRFADADDERCARARAWTRALDLYPDTPR